MRDGDFRMPGSAMKYRDLSLAGSLASHARANERRKLDGRLLENTFNRIAAVGDSWKSWQNEFPLA